MHHGLCVSVPLVIFFSNTSMYYLSHQILYLLSLFFFLNSCRLESGGTGRVKPFAVEIRNVKCARCGNFGHQSGDRECPLKDSITAIEEERQKRDDPLTSMMNAMSDEVCFCFYSL